MPDQEKYAAAIIQAEERVAAADENYREGARDGLDQLNRANRKLADAWSAYNQCSGGRIPDKR